MGVNQVHAPKSALDSLLHFDSRKLGYDISCTDAVAVCKDLADRMYLPSKTKETHGCLILIS